MADDAALDFGDLLRLEAGAASDTRAGALDAGSAGPAQNRRRNARAPNGGRVSWPRSTRSRLYLLGFAEPDIARYVLQLIKNARDKKELKVTDWAMIVRHRRRGARRSPPTRPSIREPRAAPGSVALPASSCRAERPDRRRGDRRRRRDRRRSRRR